MLSCSEAHWELLLQELGLTGDLETELNEQSVAHFAQCAMEFNSRAPQGSPMEVPYLAALIRIATTITWDKVFAGSSGASIVGRPRNGKSGHTRDGIADNRRDDEPREVGGGFTQR